MENKTLKNPSIYLINDEIKQLDTLMKNMEEFYKNNYLTQEKLTGIRDYYERSFSKNEIEQVKLNFFFAISRTELNEKELINNHTMVNQHLIKINKLLQTLEADQQATKKAEISELFNKEITINDQAMTRQDLLNTKIPSLFEYDIPKQLFYHVMHATIGYAPIGELLQKEITQNKDKETAKTIQTRATANKAAFLALEAIREEKNLPEELKEFAEAITNHETESVKKILQIHRGIHNRAQHPRLNQVFDFFREFLLWIGLISRSDVIEDNTQKNQSGGRFFKHPKTTSQKRSERYLRSVGDLANNPIFDEEEQKKTMELFESVKTNIEELVNRDSHTHSPLTAK